MHSTARESAVVGDWAVSYTRSGGQRPPVLLIHGNSSCKEVFEHQISFLTNRGYQVVAADLPGHGDSSAPADPSDVYSFPGYARSMCTLMQTLGLQSYHVVGWSLGGHIGIEMWSTMDSVRSLTITGTPPVRLSAAGVAESFKPSEIMQLAGKQDFSDEDALAYGKAMLDGHFDPHTTLGRCVKSADGRARRMMMQNGLAGIGIDQVHAVATCPKPLAILQGKNDPFVDVTHIGSLTYRNLWRKNPVLLEAGHAPHWTHPDLFTEFLGDFLSEVN